MPRSELTAADQRAFEILACRLCLFVVTFGRIPIPFQQCLCFVEWPATRVEQGPWLVVLVPLAVDILPFAQRTLDH